MKPKILVILGPTASGKSSLAVELALKFNGEIISADSRQVYIGMDIGTGKIRKDEMKGVQHYLLDISTPEKQISAIEWSKLAMEKIKNILSRGKLPIICGGTGFYIDTLLGRFTPPNVDLNPELRKDLENKSLGELIGILEKLDGDRLEKIDKNNRHRLIRSIEIAKALGHVPVTNTQIAKDFPYEVIEIGVKLTDEKLKENIYRRLIARLENGMIEEVQKLLENGVGHKRLESFGLEYRYISQHIRGLISKKELTEILNTKIWQYARRQKTWWRKNTNIKWFNPENLSEIEKTVSEFVKEK